MAEGYQGAYTGAQIDEAIGKALSGGIVGPPGPAGADGADGAPGQKGDPGEGVPAGGTTGQVLAKRSNADYDTEWVNQSGGGSASSGVSSFKGRTGAVTPQNGDYSVGQVTGSAPAASPVFTGSISMGRKSGTAVGKNSVALGGGSTEATADNAIAIGYLAEASGEYSCALGNARATARNAFSVGDNSAASGIGSAALGGGIASGQYALGCCNNYDASGNFSCSIGQSTKTTADFSFACGANNKNISTTDRFIVGSGVDSTFSNAFRVTTSAVYGGNYNSSGADYAELFEWADGNPEGEDRAGCFVTLDGERIRIAGPEDDYILGIVSGNPSVVGDVHDDQWQGMYLRDIFGRPLWEDVEVPDRLGPEGEVLIPAHIERRQKRNPDYDGSQTYRPRSQRPEWDAVGMLGKLVTVDDGTCQPNGWAAVGEGGIAVASKARTRYRVMSRLDDTHVRILIL